MDHIRRPETVNDGIITAFMSAIKAVQGTPGSALRVVFRKADGSIRTMDVAYDDKIAESFSKNLTEAQERANANRAATNEVARNLPVRERIKDENGKYIFQWRTIPVSRVLSVSPCL